MKRIMTNFLLFLTTLVLLTGSVGCGNSNQVQTDSGKGQTGINKGDLIEAPKTNTEEKGHSTNANLTNNEVKDILNRLIPKAEGIYGIFNGTGSFKVDVTKTIPGEAGYALVIDQNFKSVADLKKAAEEVFTKDRAQKVFYSRYLTPDPGSRPLYKDYEGELYVDNQNGGHGWATKFLIDTAKIKTQKDHVVEIALDTTVLDDPYGALIIKIEYVNGKWLMSSGLDDYDSIINGSVK
ncbi:hypothetical protein [Paenibacillus sp. UNC451MF]|uniref:hypothetical protein n=1 Tax=Paenibacillus sp. UNC451MF TaxID=1449063 RepID=UPI00048CC1E4|nr:hypothetical protein [Paenibacillus sp. UNC451MF]